MYSHTVYMVPLRSTASETATMPICPVVYGGCLEHSQRKSELENPLLSLTHTRRCRWNQKVSWAKGLKGGFSCYAPPVQSEKHWFLASWRKMKPEAEGRAGVKHRTLHSAKTFAIFFFLTCGRFLCLLGVEWRWTRCLILWWGLLPAQVGAHQNYREKMAMRPLPAHQRTEVRACTTAFLFLTSGSTRYCNVYSSWERSSQMGWRSYTDGHRASCSSAPLNNWL